MKLNVACIQVKDIQSVYTKISLLAHLSTCQSCYLCFIKFMKVLTNISLVKHCYEISLENTPGVELRALLFCFFFSC